jgi:hypothetical protein
MNEVNEGVQIILNRMETNPEEFFGDSYKWRWVFGENLREVMSEPEKAAIHSAMTKVRRLEITAKAVATVMAEKEEEEDRNMKAEAYQKRVGSPFGEAPMKREGSAVNYGKIIRGGSIK